MSRPPKKKSLIFILSLWQRERQTHRVANAKQLLSLLSHRSGLKASRSQKRLSKEDRSLRFALCVRRSASLSFFCVLHLGRLRSFARTGRRDQEAILQTYYVAKRSGNLLD